MIADFNIFSMPDDFALRNTRQARIDGFSKRRFRNVASIVGLDNPSLSCKILCWKSSKEENHESFAGKKSSSVRGAISVCHLKDSDRRASGSASASRPGNSSASVMRSRAPFQVHSEKASRLSRVLRGCCTNHSDRPPYEKNSEAGIFVDRKVFLWGRLRTLLSF